MSIRPGRTMPGLVMPGLKMPGLKVPGLAMMVAAAVTGLPILGSPAQGQVSVDQRALQGLDAGPATNQAKGNRSRPQRQRARPAPAKPQTASTRPTAPHAREPAAQQATPAKPAQATEPAVPTAPPAVASVPPAVAVPIPAPQPPPPVPVSAGAAGDVNKVLGGIRVTFGPGSSELNPTTEAALRSLARTLKADAQASVNVLAYAAGSPEDPSTPRRLSLARGLAARAVLLNEGIASTRIYVRALGAPLPGAPADRVDVVQVGIGPHAADAPR